MTFLDFIITVRIGLFVAVRFAENYAARYWEDPFTFRPERFMGEWNRDAFVPFSGGARACIGRA